MRSDKLVVLLQSLTSKSELFRGQILAESQSSAMSGDIMQAQDSE